MPSDIRFDAFHHEMCYLVKCLLYRDRWSAVFKTRFQPTIPVVCRTLFLDNFFSAGISLEYLKSSTKFVRNRILLYFSPFARHVNNSEDLVGCVYEFRS